MGLILFFQFVVLSKLLFYPQVGDVLQQRTLLRRRNPQHAVNTHLEFAQLFFIVYYEHIIFPDLSGFTHESITNS